MRRSQPDGLSQNRNCRWLFPLLGERVRTREDLRDFEKIPLDANATWRAGMTFLQYRRKDSDDPVLPDFFIRAQAAVMNLPHLTNDRRRTKTFPDVDFEFV